MLSLKTLLNPTSPGPEASSFYRQSPPVSSPTCSIATNFSTSTLERTIMSKHIKKEPNLAKSRLRGPVKYAPFENLDARSLEEIRRFEVEPFGSITHSCHHIPYNSGKKDFFEKTGRESFEVFRYSFRVPGQDKEYSVMWDYNVGLVRLTPFFKSCGHGKTMPAKMLSLNKGLKEITHSITGGSIAAQGYWMPYQCARAICATFCARIAGALIPIFGPSFPSQCTLVESPDFDRMVIDPQIIHEATREAEMYRRMHISAIAPPNFSSATSFPRQEHPALCRPYTPEDPRPALRPLLTCDPTWPVGHDYEGYQSAPNSASSTGSGLEAYMIAPRPPTSWTPANVPVAPYYDLHQPHPDLTAIPRMQPTHQHHYSYSAPPAWGTKRRLDYEDSDYIHEGSASPWTMSPAARTESSVASPLREMPVLERPEAEKNAAMLLLNLSMQERSPTPVGGSSPTTGTMAPQPLVAYATEVRRSKRHRASSLQN